MKTDGGFEIYIHIPFCIRKCGYCDFLSFPASDDVIDKYVAALLKEIQSKSIKSAEVSTVFIGGGTPSILMPEHIGSIMSELKSSFRLRENAEITIEANPGTINADKANAYIKNGINRVSIGLQSSQDIELQKLGRIHSWQDFLDSYNILREAGINNINVDIMSGLPLQSVRGYEETLNRVCELQPEHISAYSLIIEENTPFYHMYNDNYGKLRSELPDEEKEREQYYLTESKLSQYGYKRYEISNYAKEGYECRHNKGYWKRTPYLGFGIGAASLCNEVRFNNIRNIEKYILNSEHTEEITENVQQLTLKERMEEYMFLGMRMAEGVSKSQFKQIFGTDMEEVYGNVISKYESYGMVKTIDGRVSLTDKGIDVSNVIFSEFLQ